jgi:hypothetical protein
MASDGKGDYKVVVDQDTEQGLGGSGGSPNVMRASFSSPSGGLRVQPSPIDQLMNHPALPILCYCASSILMTVSRCRSTFALLLGFTELSEFRQSLQVVNSELPHSHSSSAYSVRTDSFLFRIRRFRISLQHEFPTLDDSISSLRVLRNHRETFRRDHVQRLG